MESALLCDITLCADDVTIGDGSFALGHAAPGDGMDLVLQHLLGTKRATQIILTGERLDAARALELGLVTEVHPREELTERAHEIAARILESPRTSRRLAHAMVQRPWRELLCASGPPGRPT